MKRSQGFIVETSHYTVRKDEQFMYIPTLQIQSFVGRIGIQATSGQQKITQPNAYMSIKQPKADMRMQTKNATLHIDQSKAWADAGLESVRSMIQKQAQNGYQSSLQGTARRVAQGAEMMRIEQDGNAIVRQAEQNAHQALKQIGLTYIPEAFSVQATYEPGNIDMYVTPKYPIIQAQARQPEHNYDRGDISIYMEQYPSLHIEVEPHFFERV